jgi:hypothetical protein
MVHTSIGASSSTATSFCMPTPEVRDLLISRRFCLEACECLFHGDGAVSRLVVADMRG